MTGSGGQRAPLEAVGIAIISEREPIKCAGTETACVASSRGRFHIRIASRTAGRHRGRLARQIRVVLFWKFV